MFRGDFWGMFVAVFSHSLGHKRTFAGVIGKIVRPVILTTLLRDYFPAARVRPTPHNPVGVGYERLPTLSATRLVSPSVRVSAITPFHSECRSPPRGRKVVDAITYPRGYYGIRCCATAQRERYENENDPNFLYGEKQFGQHQFTFLLAYRGRRGLVQEITMQVASALGQ